MSNRCCQTLHRHACIIAKHCMGVTLHGHACGPVTMDCLNTLTEYWRDVQLNSSTVIRQNCILVSVDQTFASQLLTFCAFARHQAKTFLTRQEMFFLPGKALVSLIIHRKLTVLSFSCACSIGGEMSHLKQATKSQVIAIVVSCQPSSEAFNLLARHSCNQQLFYAHASCEMNSILQSRITYFVVTVFKANVNSVWW